MVCFSSESSVKELLYLFFKTQKIFVRMKKINGNHIKEKENPELIYVYDALCGWCYGFSPVITRLKQELDQQLDFLVLSGGMVRGDNIALVSSMYDFLKKTSEEVESATGVSFGSDFLNGVLEDPDAILNSEPAALAMAAFRLEKKDQAVDYAAAIQKAIYFDGMHTDDMGGLARLAERFGISKDWFDKTITDSEVLQIVENEFNMIAKMGVKGFPTLMLRKGEDMEVISRGYKSYQQI